MELVIYNGVIVTVDASKTILTPGALVIKDDRILDIGAQENIIPIYPDYEQYDAQGKLILPGFVNSHSHTALSVQRGMVEDAGRRALYEIYFPFRELLTEEDYYTMALLGAVETLKSGTTCLAENHTNISRVIEALNQVGLRIVASEIIRDVDYLGIKDGIYRFDSKIGDGMLRKGVDLVEKWHGKENGRITCQLSPHGTDMCSAGLLKEIRSLSEKLHVGVHLHISQSSVEVEQVISREGKRPVEYLEEVGLLGPDVIGAHCFFVDKNEIEILGKTLTNIAHCSGIAARRGYAPPIWALKQAGCNICIGTDNMTGDMVEAMRLALMIARIKTADGTVFPPSEIIEMATIQGARALNLGEEIGSLEKGKKADLVMIDLQKAHLVPVINVLGNLVHYGLASDVDTVMVGGRFLMEKGRVTTVDEREVMAQAQKTAERLWEKFYQNRN
jgi:5-methylthioadenosine/S-adenosylhomocysteine deaminase